MEKERLAEHLERYHSGASNAATSRELECAFGIKGKELRDAVNALRREGVPIASNGSGYFYAATEQEVRAISIPIPQMRLGNGGNWRSGGPATRPIFPVSGPLRRASARTSMGCT